MERKQTKLIDEFHLICWFDWLINLIDWRQSIQFINSIPTNRKSNWEFIKSDKNGMEWRHSVNLFNLDFIAANAATRLDSFLLP